MPLMESDFRTLKDLTIPEEKAWIYFTFHSGVENELRPYPCGGFHIDKHIFGHQTHAFALEMSCAIGGGVYE